MQRFIVGFWGTVFLVIAPFLSGCRPDVEREQAREAAAHKPPEEVITQNATETAPTSAPRESGRIAPRKVLEELSNQEGGELTVKPESDFIRKANEIGREYVKERFSYTNGSWFGSAEFRDRFIRGKDGGHSYRGSFFCESKNVTWAVSQQTFSSEADNLNGVQWRGEVLVAGKPFRFLLSRNEWHDWVEEFWPLDALDLEVVNGKWRVNKSAQWWTTNSVLMEVLERINAK